MNWALSSFSEKGFRDSQLSAAPHTVSLGCFRTPWKEPGTCHGVSLGVVGSRVNRTTSRQSFVLSTDCVSFTVLSTV